MKGCQEQLASHVAIQVYNKILGKVSFFAWKFKFGLAAWDTVASGL